MFYLYDRKSLLFRKVTYKTYLKVAAILLILSIATVLGSIIGASKAREVARTVYHYDTLVLTGFSEKEYIRYMKNINIKYPHIVLAQSKIESGYFSSPIFKENHNLFGMKEARSRANLAKGTRRGHAYYDHWTESVLDYALFQMRYMGHIKSESEYFDYLGKHYAEDKKYVSKLKDVIKKENLEFKIDQVW